MSYQEKRGLVTLISMILIFGLFSLFVYIRYQDTIVNNPNDFQFWGRTFFIYIPVIIVSFIIIYIVYSIIYKIVTGENPPTITDERDKLVELKATRISHWAYGFGFLLAMGSQALGMQPYVMFLVLISSCFVTSIISEIAKIYLYRKGV